MTQQNSRAPIKVTMNFEE